ncbi:hypothetical protein PCE1_001417 [Barthelona sp. PCE]
MITKEIALIFALRSYLIVFELNTSPIQRISMEEIDLMLTNVFPIGDYVFVEKKFFHKNNIANNIISNSGTELFDPFEMPMIVPAINSDVAFVFPWLYMNTKFSLIHITDSGPELMNIETLFPQVNGQTMVDLPRQCFLLEFSVKRRVLRMIVFFLIGKSGILELFWEGNEPVVKFTRCCFPEISCVIDFEPFSFSFVSRPRHVFSVSNNVIYYSDSVVHMAEELPIVYNLTKFGYVFNDGIVYFMPHGFFFLDFMHNKMLFVKNDVYNVSWTKNMIFYKNISFCFGVGDDEYFWDYKWKQRELCAMFDCRATAIDDEHRVLSIFQNDVVFLEQITLENDDEYLRCISFHRRSDEGNAYSVCDIICDCDSQFVVHDVSENRVVLTLECNMYICGDDDDVSVVELPFSTSNCRVNPFFTDMIVSSDHVWHKTDVWESTPILEPCRCLGFLSETVFVLENGIFRFSSAGLICLHAFSDEFDEKRLCVTSKKAQYYEYDVLNEKFMITEYTVVDDSIRIDQDSYFECMLLYQRSKTC